ncbi:WHG domain-containing protein [Oscillochloris sp. ZM17-4]|uniref:TetR/AcrR family transcriptional regulator n=1 Tax=Oscillochloris sp. ZM17-4 TaxID=2866714 RepID=UPI001C7349F7|nr:TetR-like C-terminal domain-containing protein [Oscillochloris sp. ZM17-4]MBX0326259.1 WHG domain-containing protein [Oscillochloris sp. ZM17-4]
MKQERRARQHAAIRDEIKDTARAHMARDGAAALSLRAVASEMGLSSAAIYYYYANRDALITALIVDAYRGLGASLRAEGERLAGADVAERLLATMRAYRAWAVAHPAEYALLFGTPIPGYVGPADVTAPEARATLAVFGELFGVAAAQGRLDAGLDRQPVPASIAEHAATWIHDTGQQIPLSVLIATLRCWAIGHGLVGLELDSHLQPIIGDAAALYEHEARALLRGLGVLR